MVKLNINLDEALKSYVDAQVAAGRYRNADDLIAELLRAKVETSSAYSEQRDFGDDQPEMLRKLIQNGINSGPVQQWAKEEFEASKRRIIEKHCNRG